MKIYRGVFKQVITKDSLFSAWDMFKQGKQKREDVQAFEFHLERNIFALHRDLQAKRYRHSPYHGFYICDPKRRHIHKATVRDRVVHQAFFNVVNPIFEETFIPTSFSCRVGYGTHRGVAVLERMLWRASKNGIRRCFALKCDVAKFFDSVNHEVLLGIIKKRIKDKDALWLAEEIVRGYTTCPRERETRCLRHSHWQPDQPVVCQYLSE